MKSWVLRQMLILTYSLSGIFDHLLRGCGIRIRFDLCVFRGLDLDLIFFFLLDCRSQSVFVDAPTFLEGGMGNHEYPFLILNRHCH